MKSTTASKAKRTESLTDWRQRILAAFTRLHDKAAQQAASEELSNCIEELDQNTLPIYLAMLLDTCNTKKAGMAKESFKLIAITSTIHGQKLLPYLPKILSITVKVLKDSEINLGVRDTCAEAIGILSRNVQPAIVQENQQQTEDGTHVLGVYLRPFFSLLNEQDKGFQTGAILCIRSVIINSKQENVLKDSSRIVSRLLERLCKPGTQVHGQIFETLGKLADVVGESFIHFTPQILPLAIACLDCPDFTVRKSAACLMTALALRLGSSMGSFKNEIHKALQDHRFDKVPPVREAIAEALRAYTNLGMTVVVENGKPKQATSASTTTRSTLARTAFSRPTTSSSVLDAKSKTSTFSMRQELQQQQQQQRAMTAGDRNYNVEIYEGKKKSNQQSTGDSENQGMPTHGPSMDNERRIEQDIILEDSDSHTLQEEKAPSPPEQTATEKPTTKKQPSSAEERKQRQRRMTWVVDQTVNLQEDEVSIERQISQHEHSLLQDSQGPAEPNEQPQPQSQPQQQTNPANTKVDKKKQGGGVAFTVNFKPQQQLEERSSNGSTEIQVLQRTIRDLKREQSEMKELFTNSLKQKDEVISELWNAIHQLEHEIEHLKDQRSETHETTETHSPVGQVRKQQHEPQQSSSTTSPRTAWEQAIIFLDQGKIDEAFKKLLAANDTGLLLRLMEMTGPVLEVLEDDTRAELFNQVTPHILDTTRAVIILPWVEQALEMPPLPETHISALAAILEQASQNESSSTAASASSRLLLAMEEKWPDIC